MAASTPPKTRKASTKKATAPRKAAKARAAATSANGQNGRNYAATASSDTPPPEVFNLPPVPELIHPYGKLPVYVFNPADGSAPIVFPKIVTVPVSAKFMWKIYDLAELFQSFEWMKLAGVPRDIQERVIDLPVQERTRFWSGWFNDVTAPIDLSRDSMGPPGES